MTGAGSAYVGPFSSITSMLTGYFTNSYEGQEFVCKYSRELTRQENTMNVSGTMDGVWDDCYKAINAANGAIKYIPSIAMDNNTSARLLGEAKFFRAFNYFLLVKTFGAVPMPTEPYESMDNLYLERTAAETVYGLIESDLKDAVNALPAAKFYSNGNRVTKYAAAMMLASVYMQENKYADAATYAKMVIDSPHALATNDNLELGSAYNKIRSHEIPCHLMYILYKGDIATQLYTSFSELIMYRIIIVSAGCHKYPEILYAVESPYNIHHSLVDLSCPLAPAEGQQDEIIVLYTQAGTGLFSVYIQEIRSYRIARDYMPFRMSEVFRSFLESQENIRHVFFKKFICDARYDILFLYECRDPESLRHLYNRCAGVSSGTYDHVRSEVLQDFLRL